MKKQKDNLFLILLAVAAILIVGIVAVYFSRGTQPDVQTQRLTVQSSSDEASILEKDVLNTDLSGLDQELQEIEKELNKVE